MNEASFLSDSVRQLFSTALTNEDLIGNQLFDHNLCLCFDAFDAIFANIQSLEECNADEYTVIVSRMAPIINAVYKCYSNCDLSSLLQTSPLLNWLKNTRHFVTSAYEFMKKDSFSIVLSYLLITSSLERSVGNLILLKSNKVPPLLKDILSMQQLKQIIGKTLTFCLQVTVGPPVSLNVRNIVWHGFVAPNEIEERFAYFLLCLMFTIGRELQNNRYSSKQIVERQFIKLERNEQIEKYFAPLKDNDIEMIASELSSLQLIPSRFLPLWTLSYDLYLKRNFGFSMVVLFPVFENALRCIFANLNNCPMRVLTAQCCEFYTTFTDILSPTVGESENKIFIFYSKSEIELLMDILVLPEGLRLRDRLSHGQINLTTFPENIANFVLCSTFAIVAKSSESHANQLSLMKNKVRCYRSIFHPKARIRTVSNYSLQCLHSMVAKIKSLCYERQTENSLKCLKEENIAELVTLFDSLLIETLFREKPEMEIVVILRQIINCTYTTVMQIHNTLYTRNEQLQSRDLRSRQRNNYHKLMVVFDDVIRTLFEVITVVYLLLSNLNQNHCILFPAINIVKILRNILKMVQNICSCSHETRNKWQHCLLLSNELIQQLEKLKETVQQNEKII